MILTEWMNTTKKSLNDSMKTRSHYLLELPTFEALSQLAQDDPNAYETMRRELIEDFIDGAPDTMKQRLKGLQFRIDCERRLSRSALGATVRIYELMWKNYLSLNHEWQSLVQMGTSTDSLHGATQRPVRLPNTTARILSFEANNPRDQR